MSKLYIYEPISRGTGNAINQDELQWTGSDEADEDDDAPTLMSEPPTLGHRSMSLISDVQSRLLDSPNTFSLLTGHRQKRTSAIVDLFANNIVFKHDQVNVLKTKQSFVEKWEVFPRQQLYQKPPVIKFLSPNSGKCQGKSSMGLFYSQNLSVVPDQQLPNANICKDFLEVVDISKLVVNDILQKATGAIENLKKRESAERKTVVVREKRRLKFLTIRDFSVDSGANFIQNYILKCNSFYYEWKVSIVYVKMRTYPSSDIHLYEANFTLPSRLYPVAQATASIFFTLEAYFVIEGYRTKLNPWKFILNDGILLRVLDAKVNYFRTFTF
ncbi:uncharacterized protein LOC115890216 isoform X2 [Sitophilus oryzae]|uniref:Uncharacterized protein LOC115890216 isoform X2 n=1 Tax=Sitophilus oryzae TaxID=7048 RepID=A0A6J2YSN0_SITOR|nr:uncharacterized protein LOC115890216 isoform X2 [Sitophilus oryzae]